MKLTVYLLLIFLLGTAEIVEVQVSPGKRKPIGPKIAQGFGIKAVLVGLGGNIGGVAIQREFQIAHSHG